MYKRSSRSLLTLDELSIDFFFSFFFFLPGLRFEVHMKDEFRGQIQHNG